MKFILATVVYLLCILGVHAQGNITYTLYIVDNQNKPVPGLDIRVMEAYTLKTVQEKTDGQGRVSMELNEGRKWFVSVGEIEKCRTLNARDGQDMVMNAYYLYDLVSYRRKLQQLKTASREGFRIITQETKKNTSFKPGECFLELQLVHPDGYRLKGLKVSVVDPKQSLVYAANTDQYGMAYFILPGKKQYDIDINETTNYTYCDFEHEYSRRTLKVQFAPTVVNERIEGDTVFQETNPETQPSSERTLVLLHITEHGETVRERKVYLNQLHSKRVFAGTTDAEGRVWFLLPTGHIYLANMKYHLNMHAINLAHMEMLTYGEYHIQYVPNPRLQFPERFIPTPDHLVTTDFNYFLYKQLDRPKNKPLRLRIASALKIHKDSREALFTLELATTDSYGSVFRLPLNLLLVLDKSGSMYVEGRSEAMKFSLREIGATLSEDDIVSIVLFDHGAYRVALNTTNYQKELNYVADNYIPEGGTDIHRALSAGIEDILEHYSPQRLNRVLLMTDGYDSNPPDTVIKQVKEMAGKGIEFSTLGMGFDYNQALLWLIAENGNGNFTAIDSANFLPMAFRKELRATYNTVASDLKVAIYPHKDLLFSHLFGYPVKEQNDGQIGFHVAHLPGRSSHIAFLKFKLDKPSPEIEKHPLRVVVSYFDQVKNEQVEYTEEIPLVWTDETDTEYLFDQEEKKLYAIAVMNQTLKVMSQAYEAGDNKAAKQHLKAGRKQIEDIYPDSKPREVKKLFDEVDGYIELFNQIEMNK